MKKLLCLFLSILLLLPGLSVVISAAADPYWACLSAYESAVASGDDAKIIKACEELWALYPKLNTDEACSRTRYPLLNLYNAYKRQNKISDMERASTAYKTVLRYQKENETLYWFLSTEYDDAVKADRRDKIISSAEEIVALYTPHTSADTCRRCIAPLQKLITLYEAAGNAKQAQSSRDRYEKLLAYIVKNGNESQRESVYFARQTDYNAALDSGDSAKIISACEAIVNLYSTLNSETACNRVLTPLMKLIALYEESGRYSDAQRSAKKYQSAVTYLDKHTKTDRTEELRYIAAILSHYAFIEPRIYAADTQSDAIPFYGQKNEPEVGTVVGMSGTYLGGRDNAYLLYVQFFNESVGSFLWRLPQTSERYTLEIAWNVPHETREDIDLINSGAYDNYIIENMKSIASLADKCDVLLRFGAEINNWSCNTEYYKNGTLADFEKAFIKAFRRIADFAHTYAPNAAMVYSPESIDNLYVTVEDFYPGDAYVDWVGMSAYMNRSASASGQHGNRADAYYSRGVYENQIVKIKHIVDAFGDRKPIMISECGFMYKCATSAQDAAHAREKMEYFYSYVNMVYPQVKAIFYFNTNFNGNEYQLFDENGKAVAPKAVAEQYTAMLTRNEAIASTLAGTPKSYVPITSFSDKTDSLTLSLFAAYPGNPKITVTYALDGKTVCTATAVPYSCTLSAAQLSQGRHTLKVSSTCGQSKYTKEYVLYVSSAGVVSVTEKDMTDVKTTDWSYKCISYCMAEGFFDGLVGTTFSPRKAVTRGMFVTLLGRAAGVDISAYGAPDFADVPANAYYAPYVSWAREAGVTQGTSVKDNTFSPDLVLTRDQVCAMLVRYCDNAGISLQSGDSVPFADDNKIPSYFKDSVYRARAAAIINGKDGNRFDPAGELTREQICSILMNFHAKYIGN